MTYAYKGNGFILGVPARDLEEADVAALTPEQLEEVKASGLYEEDAP